MLEAPVIGLYLFHKFGLVTPPTLRIMRYKIPPQRNWYGKCIESTNPRSGPAPKVYQRLCPRLTLKRDWLRYCAHPSFNFYKGQNSAKFGLDFRPQSTLTRSDFETQQHYMKLKRCAGSGVNDVSIPQIWRRCTASSNSDKQKTQLWIVRFRSYLVQSWSRDS